MTTPAGRDNGLPPASRYVALVDVDPPVADHVLELLRDAGVTAVAEPLAGDLGLARDMAPPRRPTERVHVDGASLALARTVIEQALPALRADFHADAARRSDAADAARDLSRRDDLASAEVDSRFADLVAGFDIAPDGSTTPWPSVENTSRVEPPEKPTPRPPLSSRLLRSTTDRVEPTPRAPDHEVDDHFVPDLPPPLPESDRVTRLAWAALLGGPALIGLGALLNIGLDSWVVVLALVAFLGGFATLVARMRDHGPDDGWDDGAVL